MYLGLFSYHRIACHSGQLDIYRVQSTLRSLFAKMALLGWACALLFPLSVLVHGHGNMVRPCAWWDANKIGWYFLENGDESMVGCGTLNLPPNEFEQLTDRAPDCARMWFILHKDNSSRGPRTDPPRGNVSARGQMHWTGCRE